MGRLDSRGSQVLQEKSFYWLDLGRGALNCNKGEGDPENHIEELGGKPGE